MSYFSNLARDYKLEIETAPGVWSIVPGLFELSPQIEGELQDDSDYDSDGWQSQTKTAQGFTLEASFNRKRDVDTYEHPASHEVLRLAALGFRESAEVKFRYYDKLGGPEAFQGRGSVQWERVNSAVPDLDAAKVTITGQGALTPLGEIGNPANLSTKPDIAYLQPTGLPLAGGALVARGNFFTGVTAVTLGGDAVPFTIVDGHTIAIAAPADDAGSVNLVITNPAGASDPAAVVYSA